MLTNHRFLAFERGDVTWFRGTIIFERVSVHIPREMEIPVVIDDEAQSVMCVPFDFPILRESSEGPVVFPQTSVTGCHVPIGIEARQKLVGSSGKEVESCRGSCPDFKDICLAHGRVFDGSVHDTRAFGEMIQKMWVVSDERWWQPCVALVGRNRTRDPDTSSGSTIGLRADFIPEFRGLTSRLLGQEPRAPDIARLRDGRPHRFDRRLQLFDRDLLGRFARDGEVPAVTADHDPGICGLHREIRDEGGREIPWGPLSECRSIDEGNVRGLGALQAESTSERDHARLGRVTVCELEFERILGQAYDLRLIFCSSRLLTLVHVRH